MNRALSTWLVLVIISCFAMIVPAAASADEFDESPPRWEPLLWGGPVAPGEQAPPNGNAQSADNGTDYQGTSAQTEPPSTEEPIAAASPSPESLPPQLVNVEDMTQPTGPVFIAPPVASVILNPATEASGDYFHAPFRSLALRNIPPLYVTPVMPGEGVWEYRGTPLGCDGSPVMFRTSYRPSVEFPNATVHMLLLDMKKLSMRLYIGSSEPGAAPGTSVVEPSDRARVVAVTNAMWKQKHSGEGGTIFRGKVLKKLAPGLATLVVYKNGSVDILEWSDDMPVSEIQDAKQLRHLIVKDGQVVTAVEQGGRLIDSEIGLGYLLVEDESPNPYQQYWGGWWGGWSGGGPSHTSGEQWFLATRSAFGIRSDGNLVFAIGHHIGTKDLAKALVLAGCQRAIHGDANPHNVVGNIYHNDGNGHCVKKEKLSPDQKTYTLDRYVDRSYSSDFFAFFANPEEGGYSTRDGAEADFNTMSASVSE